MMLKCTRDVTFRLRLGRCGHRNRNFGAYTGGTGNNQGGADLRGALSHTDQAEVAKRGAIYIETVPVVRDTEDERRAVCFQRHSERVSRCVPHYVSDGLLGDA